MKNKTKELVKNFREAQVQIYTHVKAEFKKKKISLNDVRKRYGVTAADIYSWQRDYHKCFSIVEKIINSPTNKTK